MENKAADALSRMSKAIEFAALTLATIFQSGLVDFEVEGDKKTLSGREAPSGYTVLNNILLF